MVRRAGSKRLEKFSQKNGVHNKMHTDSTSPLSSSLLRRAASLAAVACVCTMGAHAQASTSSNDTAAVPTAAQLVALPTNNFSVDHLDLAQVAGVGYSSSAAPGDVDVNEAATLDLKGIPDLQPPPRRRYGRPRYNDSSHNPDGSNKYTFIAGVGFTLPTGNLHKYNSPSYSFQVGAGRNFNKNLGVLVQFDWDNFGLQGSNVNNELALYNLAGAGLDSLSGSTHIWSFTLDPVYNIRSGEGLGAYVTAGVGFYHKVTTFTTPQTGLAETVFGIEEIEYNGEFDHYTSNAVGVNAGFGLTYKPSRFANERFYAEARYVYVDNSQRQGYTIANANTTTYQGYDFYPANGNKSEYIPIKFGVRF